MNKITNRRIDAKGRLPPETDYKSYRFSTQEFVMYFLSSGLFMAAVSWLFYDSVLAWLLLMPVAAYFLKDKERYACLKRKRKLEVEFREVILSAASNLQAGYSIENAFQEDIRDFADIFQIAKRGGGDLRGIITNTAQIIGGKQEIRREIETVVSEKRFEQQIMRCIPFFIIFYISLTTKGYFESLYHNLFGWMLMTAALAVYIVACRISDRILHIEI